MILKANVKYSRIATGPTKNSTTNLALILSPLLANSLVCIARTRYAWKLDEMRPRVSHRNSSLYEISKCLFPVFYILPAFYLCHELGGQKIRMNWVKHIFLYKKLHFWSSISNYRLKNSKCGRVKPRSDIP